MKKHVLIIFICFSVPSFAQVPELGEYLIAFDTRVIGTNNYDNDCHNWYDLYTRIDNGQIILEEYVRMNNINSQTWVDRHHERIIPVNSKLTGFGFKGGRRWKNITGCTGNESWSIEYKPSYTNSFCSYYTNIIPEWNSTVQVNVSPKALNLYYFNRLNNHETNPTLFYLPENHKIQIKATSGFPAAVYRWQYQIGDGAWNNLSSALHNHSNVLTFSGKDIPFIDFINDVLLPKKNIKVRINYGCDVSQPIILIPLLSGPNLTVETSSPTCSYLQDGKISVKLNRNLYGGETITFTLDGIPQNPQNISALSDDNTFILEGYGAFTNRVLSFMGRFNNLDTYSDDPALQNVNINIQERPPINFNFAIADVHCYNGQDGAITITASGGTQQFISFLVQGNDTLQTISLSESVGAAFTNLNTGSYIVKLKDSNQCDPKDAADQPITYTLEVGQPTQGAVVNTIDASEPLGFGLSDGYITVRSQYGTMPYSFEWKDLHNNAVLTAEPSVTEGASMKSTLSNLGKGKYFVHVYDANYAAVSPKTPVNLRGCYDTLTIVLDQPPLLEVKLKEDHYVSCYGYTDGKMIASAKGGRPYIAGQPFHPYQYEWFLIRDGSLVPFGASDSTAAERPSARYRIKVTDRNGIVAWSDDLHLDQPQPLRVAFQTSKLLCNGDSNGISEALPTGGTHPYRYAWSNDEVTRSIQNLVEGWYAVVVTDDRQCTTLGQTQVEVPNGMEVTATLKNPTCNEYKDGYIQVATAGGNAPYNYLWQHQANLGNFATDLGKGAYRVKVEDSNNCFVEHTYTLEEPALLNVSLGNDKVLCKEQVIHFNAAIDDHQAQYAWTKDGNQISTSAALSLSDAGVYVLKITDSNGCANQDEIKITRDETIISADFAVATRVPKGERVRIANIANPAPEKIEWIIPAGVTIHDQKTEYLELAFDNYGEYVLGLKSVMGACDKAEYKTIQVVSRGELPDYQTPNEPYIKQFVVTPNPNRGNFTVTVELKEATNFKLVFYSGQGTVVATKEVQAQSFGQVNFDLASSVSDGIYMLQLITPQGMGSFKVMVNK